MRQTIEQASAVKPILRHGFSTGRLQRRSGWDGLPHGVSVFIKSGALDPPCRPRVFKPNMFFRLLRLIIFALVVSAPLSFDAMAQAIGHGSAALIADQQKVIQELGAKTDDLEKQIQQNVEDDATLVEIRLQLEDLTRAALTSALAFRSVSTTSMAHPGAGSSAGRGSAARARHRDQRTPGAGVERPKSMRSSPARKICRSVSMG